jgi:16S rRNA (uracil1498-N3)-methyltransferase
MVPRLFFDSPLAPGRTVVLPPRQAHHALRVLRLGAGDDVVLFDGGGGEYAGRIEPAGAALRVALLRHEPADRAPPLAVTLAQALVAAEKMDWLVQKATELGVAAIAPIETERCVVRLSGERSARRVAHLREVAVSACEQCGLNRVPQVADLERLPDFLAAAAQIEAARIVLAPGASRRLVELPRPSGRVILLVGPEGGFGDNELAAARSCGFEQASLGPRTLRTETAGLAAIAAMLALWGDF